VSVPAVSVTLDPQQYTLLGIEDGQLCARFENADGFFAAVLRSVPNASCDGRTATTRTLNRRFPPSLRQ
jgi:hypothetical protein